MGSMNKPKNLGPTPETLAKRRFPPWENWPSELQKAAIEIDTAVRLVAGGSLVGNCNLDHIAHGAALGWTEGQIRIVGRYRRWVAEMRLWLWQPWRIEDVVVHNATPRHPAPLKAALELYAAISDG